MARVQIPTGPPFKSGCVEILQLKIRVQPRASKDEVIEQLDGTLKIKTTAPPVNDAANKACVELLANHFGVKKSDVKIVSGARSRDKIFEIGL